MHLNAIVSRYGQTSGISVAGLGANADFMLVMLFLESNQVNLGGLLVLRAMESAATSLSQMRTHC